jgi:hypothetical protein
LQQPKEFALKVVATSEDKLLSQFRWFGSLRKTNNHAIYKLKELYFVNELKSWTFQAGGSTKRDRYGRVELVGVE